MGPIFGKKKKDAKGIADVQSGKQKSYVTVSRKAKNPITGNTMHRGATVTSAPKKMLTGSTTVPSGIKFNTSPGSVRVTSSYQKQDYNDNKVNNRATDMSFVKKYNESPAKVQTRMNAQANEKETYPNPKTGAAELAGKSTSVTKITPGKVTATSTKKTVPTYGVAPGLKVTPASSVKQSDLKPMAAVRGGSTKGDIPANKYGTGKKSGFKVNRKQVFSKR